MLHTGSSPLLALLRHSIAGALLLLALVRPLHAGDNSPTAFAENEVKAAFVYNFAHFVRWPEGHSLRPGEPFRYCVLDDALAVLLAKAVAGETLDGHPLIVQRQPDPRNFQECHLIYFGDQSAISPGTQTELLRRLTGPILTVSDQPGFAARGGMITLTHKRGRIHPIINTDAIERTELRVSAKLLNLATLTRDGKGSAP
ncbi:MAG: YfiR family protein [Zoogloea sp.]|uniref:YfiR family protein n=1 Tax=Zoogloea sp. TaxID=49181 RepID=UPI0026031064|nr:YfiR family protein [Zoogloea sp.]MDD2991741.1 YfiR family protein [Zoogloea sp.]